MKISIITAAYNSEKTIAKTIESVLAQSVEDYEYIIIDGASTDSTLTIVNRYKSQFKGKLTVVSEPDTGIYNGFNKGVGIARGELIGIINSDDWLEPDAFEKVLRIYKKHNCPKYAVFHGLIKLYRETENYPYQIYGRHHNDLLEHGHMIAHPSCFVTQKTYADMGGFDETFFLAADQELMTRYILKDVPFYFENAVLANFTHGGATTQTKNQNQLIEESIKICQKHNLDTLLHKKHSKDLKKKKWSWR